MGLVVNTWAAFLFGYATAENQARMFFYAGLVIIGSGFFDLVDGEVARATNRVTRFGAFFDSVIDRYSRRLTIFWHCWFLRSRRPVLLRRANRFCNGQRHHGQLHACASGIF